MNLLDLVVKIGVDDQASGQISGIASGIVDKAGSAVAGAGKIAAGVTAAAASGAVALGSAALDTYGQYEQLAGGIAKLYGDSADVVKENAQRAYQTAGMSANEYMDTAMQFSAALVNSVGGDTEEAARLTDVAMRAMSDNINTFGSDSEAVMNAVIGMSRGNYTMIDNLKLGYSGTAEGMMELINASGVLGETLTDTSQLADVGFGTMIEAIQAVQEQQGIAGTTANEAATTVEGSIGSTKAAWDNLLAEFGKEDGDIGARLTELVDSAITMLLGAVDENGEKISSGLIGKLGEIFTNLATSLPEQMPKITAAIQQVLPQLADAVMIALPAILDALSTVILALSTQIGPILSTLVPVIIECLPMVVEAGMNLFLGLIQGLNDAAPEISNTLFNAIGAIIQIILDNAPALLLAAGELFVTLVTALTNKREEITAELFAALGDVVAGLVDGAAGLLSAASDFFGNIVSGAQSIAVPLATFIGSLPGAILSTLGNLGETLLQSGKDLLNGLINGITAIFNGDGEETVEGFIKSIPGKITGFLEALNPIELLVSVGTNIMQGLVNGITSFNLRDAIVGVFGDVGAIACDALGIQSPSKVFKEIGGYTMEGMAVGIEDAADKAIAATRDAVGGVYDAASGNVDVSMSTSQDNNMLALLAQIRDNMNMSVYLDGNTLVGGIAPSMNYALGVI